MNHAEKKALTAKTLGFFWHHARTYWPMLILCGAGIAITIGCDIVLPLIYKQFFDQLAAILSRKTAATPNLAALRHTLALIGITMACSWAGWRAVMIAAMDFESRAMKDLADTGFEHLQRHSHRFFTDSFAGALVKRINRFSAGFEVIADQIAINMGQTIIRIVLLVGVLFWRNAVLGWIFFAWTVLFVTFNFFFARWKLKYDLVRAELDTKVTARLSDTIANAINLKLFAGTDREVAAFKDITDEHRKARWKSWWLGWCSEGIQGLSIRGLEIVILVMAIPFAIAGALTLGDFVLLRSYLSQLTEEVRSMGGNIRRIYESIADANEMTEILLKPHEIVNAPNAVELVAPKGGIEFRNVQFSYANGGRTILPDFSIKLDPGARLGIVGPSGGGKSTILKLLVRLYDVTGGEILIDSQNIARVTQESLHRNIAYVPQDPILFHRSLMENIRYPRPAATDEEVVRAAKLAHCHEFITNFPDGYHTLVGERGVKLSGGERQRVAIARAILMNAPILVLDEATSSLDSESERYIQDSLAKLMVDRTVIAVAHRLSTIRKMDCIAVIDDGEILEVGNHNVLVMTEKGVYQRLWNLQVMENTESVTHTESAVS